MTGSGGLAFLGREAELTAAREALTALPRGSGPVAIVIDGEPGIGKTMLVRQAAHLTDGIRVLTMAGFEPARRIPLGAAAELFPVLQRSSPEGPALTGLLRPETSTSGPLEPLRMFEATRAALFAIAPVLILFDDVQWADETSVALCHYVLRAAASDHVALGLILASRPGVHVPELSRALQESDVRTLEMSLGPLDRDAGVALARRIDSGLTPEDAERVYDAAAGSPFWIEALVRRSGGQGRTVDAITQRLESLSGDDAACLAAVVVAARPIAPADLADLLGWPHARVMTAAGALVDRGLLVASGPHVRVVHDLVRETAYRQIAASEMRRLHRRVAEWLEQEAGEDLHELTEALAHRVVVGTPPLDLALRIARSPQRRLLGSDGVAQLAAIVDGAAWTDPEVAALQGEIATIYGELGEREAAYERFLVLADRLPTPRERAQAALNAARQAIDLQRSADAAVMTGRALAIEDDPWIQVEAAALEHARRMWIDFDLTGGRAATERAVADARQLVTSAGGVEQLDADARRAYVEVLSAAYDIALTDDAAQEMAVAARERVVATRGLGEPHLVAAADAARMLWWSGRMQEAATQLDAVLDEARRQVYPALVADLCHVVGFNYYALGRLVEAARLLDEADKIEARIGNRTRRSVPWIRGGLRYLIEASVKDWRSAVAGMQSKAASYSNPHARLRLHHWAALIAARFGEVGAREEVRAETNAALTDADAAGCRRCYWDVTLNSVECLVRVGDVADGAELLRRWDASHPRSHLRFGVERDWAHALIVAAHRPGVGAVMLAEVVDAARTRERRLDQLWTMIDLGRAQAFSDTRAAIETWTEAITLAQTTSAVTEIEVVRRELRGVGARTQARRTEGIPLTLPTLTGREFEVARLVASGRRNSEIAETLFLSPKTVERHLSSIFSKLAVRSRAELIAQYAGHLRP